MRLIDADALPREKMLAARGNGQYEDVDIVYGSDIDNAPTFDPVRYGRWEERKVGGFWQSAKCSVCGRYHTTPYIYSFKDYNYCPHCGAKMEADNAAG